MIRLTLLLALTGALAGLALSASTGSDSSRTAVAGSSALLLQQPSPAFGLSPSTPASIAAKRYHRPGLKHTTTGGGYSKQANSGQAEDHAPEQKAPEKPYYGSYGGEAHQQPESPYESPYESPDMSHGPGQRHYHYYEGPKRGCGGDLPPACSTSPKLRPDYEDSSHYGGRPTDSYYAGDFQETSYKRNPCSKAESIYAWSAECATPSMLGDTCEGAALCERTNAHTTALATCTVWGWVATDGCKPAGCAATPTSQLATFGGCNTPGVLDQQCQGTCTVPSVGAPVATCTPTGWAISGPLCDFNACRDAVPPPCDGNATCTDNPPPALDATCRCLDGFFGNGLPGNCTEINACQATPAPCDVNAVCTDNPPPSTGATCQCLPGFTGNGLPGNCTEINACAAIPAPCDINANCTDNPPPFTNATCTCKEGFVGTGLPGNCTEAEDGCSVGNNPCAANAVCTDKEPPLSGATCVCSANFTGDGFESGSGCTACTGTQWSPGGDVPCSDFSLHSQFLGTDSQVSQPRSVRSLATNGSFVYVGMIRGTDTSDVIKLPVPPQQFLIGNGPIPYTLSTNPYFNVGVLARVAPANFPQGPKGMALDDNGFIYHTENSGTVYARDPNTAGLDILAATVAGPVGTSLAENAEALAFKLLQGVRLLFGCSQNNAGINRLQINYSGGKPASFSAVSPIVIPAPGGCRGVVVEDDGTIFYTGVAAISGGLASHFVAKVAPDGTELARRTVGGAWGLATYRGKVYVAQYLSTNTVAAGSTGSGVAVLDAADLSPISTLKPPAALVRTQQDTDSGYSGVAISPTGILYVADQVWRRIDNAAAAGASFTPAPVNQTATVINSGRWFFDRVLQRQV